MTQNQLNNIILNIDEDYYSLSPDDIFDIIEPIYQNDEFAEPEYIIH